jgi:hypothetical protein
MTSIHINTENPRRVSKEKIEKLQERINRLGFYSVIKVDTNNIVLGGNQRLLALKKLGLKEVEVLYPSRELTEDERAEVIITDNTHIGDFDYGILTSQYSSDFLAELDVPIFDDLLREEEETEDLFGENLKPENDTFQIFFNFPTEYKKEVLDKLKERGKDKISEQVLDLILSC